MITELSPEGMFLERLAQYLRYMGSSDHASDILKVSFQFLSKGNDNEVEEVVALIQNGARSPALQMSRRGY